MIDLEFAGQNWPTIIDTGFNGDLELPLELKDLLPCRYIGQMTSLLAGGQRIEEVAFHVELQFDGQHVRAEATFVPDRQVLLGTRLLQSHRLEIDFPARAVALRRDEG